MVKTKETKKVAENLNTHLNLVMKSGKVALGYKSGLKNLRKAKGKNSKFSNPKLN